MIAEACKKHLEISKTGFEALTKVIEFSCSACGLCVSLCPTEAIAMQNNVPTLVGQCTKCGFCYQGCPRSFSPLGKVKERFFGAEQNEVDTRVGRCVDRFTARSLTDEIFDRGANGGTATALLIICWRKILLTLFSIWVKFMRTASSAIMLKPLSQPVLKRPCGAPSQKTRSARSCMT